ncbi:chain-length determining protein [Puniceibacterium sp. IMCC21224]|uniref:chain-length determining protein n=1 Tax=Puniceibacterium sp. IMCC21224 TaxID=1618204 RepID=UPI00064DC31D|nr:chain-length determining protein [Puniceibacterium sp. IMCC21224]KMK65645.1 uncharacterized protein involved in exopolysaccharide biosynthesis [Puniceibacterium sp. IMCC21224]
MNQFQSVAEVFAALRRRAFLILVIVAIGCVLSLRFAVDQTRLYETTAVVQIEDARVPDSLAGAGAQADDAAHRVRLIEQRLMSRDNLMAIMEKHNLFVGDSSQSLNERVFMMREAARIEEIVNSAQSWQPGVTPSGLRISVTLDDPQMAADLANELMYSVIEQSRERSLSRARDTFSFFAEESARAEEEIAAMEEKIATFKRDNADNLPAGTAALRDQIRTLRDNEMLLDQEIVTLRSTADRQREEVQARQIGLLEEQKSLVSRRIEAIEATIRSAPEVERALNGLERELSRLQEKYSVITRRKAEAEMGQMLEDRQQSDRFEILETALVPEYPVSRSRKKTAIMGAVASVIVALGVAFVFELMNPAIRNAAQMERMLGIQPVVSIPHISTRADRRRRGLGLVGVVLALIAGIIAVIRFAANKLPALGLDRFLPRVPQI